MRVEQKREPLPASTDLRRALPLFRLLGLIKIHPTNPSNSVHCFLTHMMNGGLVKAVPFFCLYKPNRTILSKKKKRLFGGSMRHFCTKLSRGSGAAAFIEIRSPHRRPSHGGECGCGIDRSPVQRCSSQPLGVQSACQWFSLVKPPNPKAIVSQSIRPLSAFRTFHANRLHLQNCLHDLTQIDEAFSRSPDERPSARNSDCARSFNRSRDKADAPSPRAGRCAGSSAIARFTVRSAPKKLSVDPGTWESFRPRQLAELPRNLKELLRGQAGPAQVRGNLGMGLSIRSLFPRRGAHYRKFPRADVPNWGQN